MATLNTHPNVPRPDDIYELLVDLHRDCSERQSLRLDAKLIMLLVNHIGDPQVIREAVQLARSSHP